MDSLEKEIPNVESKLIYNYLWRRDDIHYLDNILNKKIISYARHILDLYRPDVIVATDDGPTVFVTFTKIARLRRIPVLVVQDGLKTRKLDYNMRFEILIDILRWKRFVIWRLLSKVSQLKIIAKFTLLIGWRTRVLEWGHGGANLYAVFGSRTKQLLISRGVASNKIKITGFPLFDDIINIDESEKRRLKQKINVKNNNKCILFLSQPLLSHRMWMKEARDIFVNSLVQDTEKLRVNLIIKLHPREYGNKYQKIALKNRHVIILKDFDLHELTLISDVVLTINSTAALWAMIYKKPLIAYQDGSFPEENWYNGVAIEVNDLLNLFAILKKLLENDDTKINYLDTTRINVYDYIYKIDGNSSNRIANLIVYLYNLCR